MVSGALKTNTALLELDLGSEEWNLSEARQSNDTISIRHDNDINSKFTWNRRERSVERGVEMQQYFN